MTNYSISYSKAHECDVHIIETDTMCIYSENDIVEFLEDEELLLEFGIDINFHDDYSVNGFYITGADLIDFMS